MELNWRKSGILLGITFFLAVLLVKPIGVSTQFVILDAIIWDQFNEHVIEASETAKSGFSSVNAYLNKSGGKYAAAAADPLNYSFVFVLAIGESTAMRLAAYGENRLLEPTRDNVKSAQNRAVKVQFILKQSDQLASSR